MGQRSRRRRPPGHSDDIQLVGRNHDRQIPLVRLGRRTFTGSRRIHALEHDGARGRLMADPGPPATGNMHAVYRHLYIRHCQTPCSRATARCVGWSGKLRVALGYERGQLAPQPLAGVLQATADRARWHAQHGRDLAIRQALDVVRQNGLLLRFGQRRERPADGPGQIGRFPGSFRRGVLAGQVRLNRRRGARQQRLQRLRNTAGPAAPPPEPGPVEGDGIEPRPKPLRLVQVRQPGGRLKHGLLSQVFGLDPVAGGTREQFVDNGPVPTDEHGQRVRATRPRLADQVTVGCVGGSHHPPYRHRCLLGRYCLSPSRER